MAKMLAPASVSQYLVKSSSKGSWERWADPGTNHSTPKMVETALAVERARMPIPWPSSAAAVAWRPPPRTARAEPGLRSAS